MYIHKEFITNYFKKEITISWFFVGPLILSAKLHSHHFHLQPESQVELSVIQAMMVEKLVTFFPFSYEKSNIIS